MDVYNIVAAWLGWPLVVTLLILAIVYGTWAFNNRISFLNENISFLKDQIHTLEMENAELKDYRPDILAERLTSRLKAANNELEIFKHESERNEEKIVHKEAEIKNLEKELGSLQEQIIDAQTMLKGFTCPYCGSPLSTLSYHHMEQEDSGLRVIDWDIENREYECGLVLVDDKEIEPCKNLGNE